MKYDTIPLFLYTQLYPYNKTFCYSSGGYDIPHDTNTSKIKNYKKLYIGAFQ
jgi:hypothetical protein